MNVPAESKHYQAVEKAIGFIREHAHIQPTLKEISAAVGMSEYHLQRVFSEWAGVSPKRFLQFITKERALEALKQSADNLTVSLNLGLSSPGRLHDLMVSCEAMTPGEIKNQGKDLIIGYGHGCSPFGHTLIAWTQRGICHLEFVDGKINQLDRLRENWPETSLKEDVAQANRLLDKIFFAKDSAQKFHLIVRGTNFQIKVWQALLNIQSAQVCSYQQLAQSIDSPKASRAVGSAVAQNNIGYLIPCHRVIRGNGESGMYRWGSNRKLAIQVWESFKSPQIN